MQEILDLDSIPKSFINFLNENIINLNSFTQNGMAFFIQYILLLEGKCVSLETIKENYISNNFDIRCGAHKFVHWSTLPFPKMLQI